MNPEPNKEIKEFKDIIENIHTAILFTRAKKNEWKGRPMATVKVDDKGSFWFFTDEFSNKVEEIWRNNEVVINYSNLTGNAYIRVTGKAYLSRDINKINELYSPFVQTWLPGGLNDPNLLLLRIEPQEIEYYYNGKSTHNIPQSKMLSHLINPPKYIDHIRENANLNVAY